MLKFRFNIPKILLTNYTRAIIQNLIDCEKKISKDLSYQMESKKTDNDDKVLKSKRDQYVNEIRKQKNETLLNAKRMRFTSQKENTQSVSNGNNTLNVIPNFASELTV